MKRGRSTRALAIAAIAIGALFATNAAVAGAASAGKFRKAADKICTASAKEVEGANQEHGPPQSLQEDVALTEDLIPIFRDANAQLKRLQPPKKLRADFKEYLDLRAERIQIDEEFVELGTQGAEQAALDENFAQLQDVRLQYEEVGVDLGFYACGERLSKKEEAKVRDTVTETFTTANPDFCTELYTEQFVEVFVGGLDACIASENDPANASSSIDIESVKGIDKVRAGVRFTPGAGPNAGQPGEIAAGLRGRRVQAERPERRAAGVRTFTRRRGSRRSRAAAPLQAVALDGVPTVSTPLQPPGVPSACPKPRSLVVTHGHSRSVEDRS